MIFILFLVYVLYQALIFRWSKFFMSEAYAVYCVMGEEEWLFFAGTRRIS